MIRQFPTPNEPFDGSAEHSPFVTLWYGLLAESLKRGCERIHLVPSRESETFTIRAFVDGAWEDLMAPPAKMYPGFLQVLNVMASFSLAKRLPIERGRFRFAVRGSVHEIDVTVRVRPDGLQEAIVDLPPGAAQSPG